VRGIRLKDDDAVIGMIDIKKGSLVLTISENGFAKRTDPEEYRVTNRGVKGVTNMKVTDKTGKAIFVDAVLPGYDIVISTKEGKMIRIDLDSIRETGRSAQGVKAIRLSDGDFVRDAAVIPSVEDIESASGAEKAVFENAVEVSSSDGDDTEATVDQEDESAPNEPTLET
jgi:DNA gyrase subunit A